MGKSKPKISGNVLFRETQQFRIKWLWIVLVGCVLISFGATGATAFMEKTDKREVAYALAFIVPLESLVLYLFYIVKLETAVTTDAVFYRWWPFFKNYSYISRTEIEEAKADKGPTMSYGFHYIPGYGSVHNTGPGRGMRFFLKSGKKIFIGTQKLNAFQSAVEELVKNQ